MSTDRENENHHEPKLVFSPVTWLLIFAVGYMLADFAARVTTVRAGGSWFAFPLFGS